MTSKLEVFERLLANLYKHVNAWTGSKLQPPNSGDAILFFQYHQGKSVRQLEQEFARHSGSTAC